MSRSIVAVASLFLVASMAHAQARPPRPPAPKAPAAPAAVPSAADLSDLSQLSQLSDLSGLSDLSQLSELSELSHLGPKLADLPARLDLELAPTLAGLEPMLGDVSARALDFASAFDLDSWQAAGTRQVFAGQAGDALESTQYSRGTAYLDRGRYEQALAAFEKVIAANGKRVDGALYWKAYSLSRLGRGSEALAALDELLKKFPSSRWANDARALQVEVRQASGRPVNPAQENDEELKLLALNGLMSRDPDRGIPMVEQILSSSASPRMKERALFLLAQSGSPRAKTILTDIAKGKGNPDLQMKALEYSAILGGGPDVPLLLDVYKSSPDVEVKRRIIRSLAMAAGGRGNVFGVMPPLPPMPPVPPMPPMPPMKDLEGMSKADVEKMQAEVRAEVEKAREEMDRARQEAAHVRVVTRSTGSRERDKAREAKAKEAGDALWQLYQSEGSVELKREILRNMYFGDQTDRVTQIARTEKDPELRRAAVQALMFNRTPKTAETLASIYGTEKDPSVKKRIVEVLSTMDSAGPLVRIARQETDPQLKKAIVQRLSMMKDKEATDYMMELLKK